MSTGVYKRKKVSPRIRFFAKIYPPKPGSDDCWEWQSYKSKEGYGKFGAMGETLAHRVSYRLHKGEIPEGMFVCHSCDNPSCVNPDHLWLGTNSDNQIDCVKKGRARRVPQIGEKNGSSKLNEVQVIEIRRLHKLGFSHSKIAKRIGRSSGTVQSVLSGRTWKHVKM